MVGCIGSDVARLSLGLFSVDFIVACLSKLLESGVSFDFERSGKFERTLLMVVYADEEIEVVRDAGVMVADEDEDVVLRLLLLVVELSNV